jgi:CO/xanthine dehydrogenase Mo-binding subunit
MKNPSSLFLFSWTRLKDNQVEGAALWGLSVALREGTEIVNGQPKDTNRNTYATLRMGGLPEVDVEFIPN